VAEKADALVSDYLEAVGLAALPRDVAALSASARAWTPARMAAKLHASVHAVGEARSFLRHAFLAPAQNQLPVAILHEVIAWRAAAGGQVNLPYLRRDLPEGSSAPGEALAWQFRALRLGAPLTAYAALLVLRSGVSSSEVRKRLGWDERAARRARECLRVLLEVRDRGRVPVVLLRRTLERIDRLPR